MVVTLCPRPLGQLLLTGSIEGGKAGARNCSPGRGGQPRTRLPAASGKGWKARALAEAPIGCGSRPRTNSRRGRWRHNSRRPAAGRCSPPVSSACCDLFSPGSVEPIPWPAPGHCGLGARTQPQAGPGLEALGGHAERADSWPAVTSRTRASPHPRPHSLTRPTAARPEAAVLRTHLGGP